MLRQMPNRTNSKGNMIQNGFCAVLSGQISGPINSPCVYDINSGVGQLAKALSNEWAGNEITENPIYPWISFCIKMKVTMKKDKS